MLVKIPDLLEGSEIETIRKVLADGVFVDGKLTAGKRAKRVKNNLEMKKTADQATQLRDLILNALKRNKTFQRWALPKIVLPPLFSRYEVGMSYGLHVDNALMRRPNAVRTDLSMTVFLNDPDEYDGGELVIQGSYGEQQVKLPRGGAVMYPSSTLHCVSPVTRGERIAAVTWVQSYVRDASRREILYDLGCIRRKLSKLVPDFDVTNLASKTYGNLLRMWSDV